MSQTETVERRSRQVVRFGSLGDIVQTAHALYEAGCQPRNVDTPQKLIPILLAGAELGLGIMQSLKSITAPVNGVCNLYGDMGLALVRQSGQLQSFEEHIDGVGENRTAHCTVQRKGYTLKTFSYPMSLAMKLKSYQTAQTKGGPWKEDPDNMLMWRARWRALRSEFTDILNGMGGAEEQDDEQVITVEVVPATGPAAGVNTFPAATAPQALPDMPDDVRKNLEELVRLKGLFNTSFTNPPTSLQWDEYLAARNVKKARELSPTDLAAMVQHFGEMLDPFGYPRASADSTSGPDVSPAS